MLRRINGRYFGTAHTEDTLPASYVARKKLEDDDSDVTIHDVITTAWPGISDLVPYVPPRVVGNETVLADTNDDILALREFVDEDNGDMREHIAHGLDPKGRYDDDGLDSDEEASPFPHARISEEIAKIRAVHDEVYVSAIEEMQEIRKEAQRKIEARLKPILESARLKLRIAKKPRAKK